MLYSVSQQLSRGSFNGVISGVTAHYITGLSLTPQTIFGQYNWTSGMKI